MLIEILQGVIENRAVSLNAAWIKMGDISNISSTTEIKAEEKRDWIELYSWDDDLKFSRKKLHDMWFLLARAQLNAMECKDFIKVLKCYICLGGIDTLNLDKIKTL